MKHIALYSNVISENGGFALGRALRDAAPSLQSIDFGCPCPFSHPRVSNAITATRSPLKLSYCGMNRLDSEHLNFASSGLGTCDVILLCASAARGVPHALASLDLRSNKVDNAGITAICKAIASGGMESLAWIDLSDNPASNKFDVVDALRARGDRQLERLRAEATSNGLRTPDASSIIKFTLSPTCEFRVVPIGDDGGMPGDDD